MRAYQIVPHKSMNVGIQYYYLVGTTFFSFFFLSNKYRNNIKCHIRVIRLFEVDFQSGKFSSVILSIKLKHPKQFISYYRLIFEY